ncbi:STAS domain-containing protein [Streptomyces sp. TRM76323]|uniref:Anti-sigma factor antagonist n=1 Tax=Streptomyces tamarix TaxID=3078565 RepID=A0ABU3QTV5_9ACTN|nr:STAS domain-containing protein [Streptomyces tamarix]MDT9686213.1 STAS domain-containing protein [Streptomyces tamarix]
MAGTEQAEQPDQLSVVSTTTDGVRVLTLAGEIDHHTGDRLRRALDTSGVPRPRVVLDLGRVTFMDSSGINLLIAAHHAVTGAGGWLRLAAPTEPVLRTIRLVGLDTVIDCCPTLHQAISA